MQTEDPGARLAASRPLEEAVAVHQAFEDRTAPAKTVLAVGG